MLLFRQRVAKPHRDAAFHLDCRPGRIHDLAHILRANHPLDADPPARPIHFDFGHGRHDRVCVDTAGYAHAPSFGPGAGLPAELFCSSLQDAEEFRLAAMLQAKGQRIGPGSAGHDVDVLFPGKGVGIGRRRPPCAGCERM